MAKENDLKDTNKVEDKKSTNNSRQRKGGHTNGKSRRNNNARSNRGDKLSNIDKLGAGDKNPYYYAPDDDVMNKFTQLSQNIFGGVPIIENPKVTYEQYGIMRVCTDINIASDCTVGSGLNVGINAASRKMYQELTAFTGRAASSYTGSDISILLCCLGSLLEMISFAKRIYGTYKLYDPMNRSFPRAVLNGMGIDASMQSVFDNYKRLNTLIDQMGSLVIPACPFLVKCSFMYDEIYMDDESSLSQLFIYVPSYYYVLNETLSPNGSVAQAKSTGLVTGNVMYVKTFSQILDMIEEQFEALMKSATMAIVFADMINYASKVGSLTMMKILPVELDYIAPVRYSHEEIMRMHNAKFFGTPSVGSNIVSSVQSDTVRQDRVLDFQAAGGSNFTHDDVVTMINNAGLTKSGLLDFTDPDVVDPKVLIEATRFVSICSNLAWDNTNQKAMTTSYFSGGDHIILTIYIFNQDVRGDITTSTAKQIPNTLGIFSKDATASTVAGQLDTMCEIYSMLSRYQCAPKIATWTGFAASTNTPSFMFGRLSYYRAYDEKYINALNNRIMQYMFSIVR